MKIKLVNDNFTKDYAENYLKSKGIEDVPTYLNPPSISLQSPKALDNIQKGAEIFIDTIEAEGRILLIVDSDNDGFTSSAIIYNYIKAMDDNIEIDYLLHENKQHGLEDHIEWILENKDKYDLIIEPDAGSNDYKYHKQIIDIPCLVLDHHILESEISPNAIIINNQSSTNYKNKDLTGAGVAFQFCRYIDFLNDTYYADDLIDLAAWGIIGDMGSLISLENRYIVKKGLENIKNDFFKILIDKQSFSMKNEVTPISVAFYIVPMVNAMIRVGTMEEKKRLFEAYLDANKMVPSNKRGAKGTLELLGVESARECTNAKNRQNKIKEAAVDNLEIKIHKYDLLENKILFVRLDEDDNFPKELNGLVAMQLSAKFKKPTIVARLNDENYVKGSARGLNESALESFKDFLDSTNLFEYTAGHDNAFGISIYNENLDKLHSLANEYLKDIDFGENVYNVNFSRIAADKDIAAIADDLYDYRHLWGQNLDEPMLYVSDINLTKDDIQIIGRNNDTVKFEKFGVEYIKFFAKDLIKELEKFDNIKMEVVGKPSINEWGGRRKPQILIEDYQIENGELTF